MKYPAKNPAKFLKPEPEPDIEAGYPAGSGFSRISGRFLAWTNILFCIKLYNQYAIMCCRCIFTFSYRNRL